MSTVVRIRKQIDSETLHLAELRPLIGQTVEIIIRPEDETGAGDTPYASLFALAGTGVVDPDACRELREASKL